MDSPQSLKTDSHHLEAETYAALKARLSDPWWRLNNLYYIMDDDGNRLLFSPNHAQLSLMRDMWYLNIVLKARQLGFSTFIQIWILDRCLWNTNVRAGVIAHHRDDAEIILRDKIKYAYDNLPQSLLAVIPATKDATSEIVWANNSSVRVGTSMRSSTLQYLHVSEYGKLSRKYPDKAREVMTGSLQAVHAGNFVFVESTAEGRDGFFYRLCDRAQKHQQEGRPLTKMDFKFHFYPWFSHPDYHLPEEEVKDIAINRELTEYFDGLETALGIKIPHGRRVWWTKKYQDLGEDMYSEFPSTPEEAFKASVQGAYYAQQMAKVRKERRIKPVPYLPGIPVNVGWDLGYNDTNALIFHQFAVGEHRFIDYYENSGESLAHYVKELQDRPYIYGKHYLPHDAEVTSLNDGKTRVQTLHELGLRNLEVVPRIDTHQTGIDAVRLLLPNCYFDESKTERIIDCLDHYRKEWDDKLGAYKSTPLHDWSSHGEKAFEQIALGYRPASPSLNTNKRRRRSGSWRSV